LGRVSQKTLNQNHPQLEQPAHEHTRLQLQLQEPQLPVLPHLPLIPMSLSTSLKLRRPQIKAPVSQAREVQGPQQE